MRRLDALTRVYPKIENLVVVTIMGAVAAELRKYDEALYNKPRWLVINKVDLLPEEERAERIAALVKGYGPVEKHFVISAISGDGCKPLTYAIMEHLESLPRHNEDAETEVDEKADLE